MKLLMKSDDLEIYATKDGKGILYNRLKDLWGAEKLIVSLLSASDSWEEIEGKDKVLKEIDNLLDKSREYLADDDKEDDFDAEYDDSEGI